MLCPNPSPMTLEGTNTWLLGAPGQDGLRTLAGSQGHLPVTPYAGRRER